MPSLVRDKSGVFFIVYSENGKRVWRSTKTRDKATAYQIFLRNNKSDREKNDRTLFSFVQEYLLHVKANRAGRTHEIDSLSLGHFLDFAGDIPLAGIGAHLVDRYKIHRIEKVSPASVNIELRVIRAFFNTLKRWELITKNPTDGVSFVREPENLPPFLTVNQLQELLGKIKDEWLRSIVLFTAMTGLRRGEVLNLNWEDIDLTNKSALIHSSGSYTVKAGKMRTIPLNQTALHVLEQLPQRQGLVFRGRRGRTANGNHVGGCFRRAVRAAGLDRRLHFHSLRHTFASLLVQNNVSLYQVQKLLGHSSSRVTEVYAHLQTTRMHDVVDIISLRSQGVAPQGQNDPTPKPSDHGFAQPSV